jgi:hypothetical protein
MEKTFYDLKKAVERLMELTEAGERSPREPEVSQKPQTLDEAASAVERSVSGPGGREAAELIRRALTRLNNL